jgi:2-C-methyl-D-erythritol 4-phosphate cytidylyltransferase/2-C-methyl-D-erythritol 4-phosphate cytidylyltransferase/2-C-methyl-D-erythritol 2,4-cyclodiphosphate synthase
MNIAVVIPAGGAGRRMGGASKPLIELAGEPLLLRALRPFLDRTDVVSIVVALPRESADDPPAWLRTLDARVTVVAGGVERVHSVRNALAAVPDSVDIVLVHDAARPLLGADVLSRVIDGVRDGACAMAAVPATDTIKGVDGDGWIVASPDRSTLWHAQTPQGFPRDTLVAAHERAAADGIEPTDDAALAARYGARVRVVRGDPANLKVTTPIDLVLAETILREAAP